MDINDDDFEFGEVDDDYADFELEEDGEDDSERRPRSKTRRPVPGASRPYAIATKGVSTAQISNGAGKTAQLKLQEAAVTVPEFRKAMGAVQRDVQGSARVIRELRDELDRQRRATKRIEKGAAWSANATIFVQLLEQAKDALMDVVSAYELPKQLEELQKNGVLPKPPSSQPSGAAAGPNGAPQNGPANAGVGNAGAANAGAANAVANPAAANAAAGGQ